MLRIRFKNPFHSRMNSNMALHFKYWLGILLGVMVLIVAAAFGADPRLVDKVNFAVGITSVILALLAIYVTMAFSTLFSNNVVTFLGLNNRIEESAAKLITATTDLNAKLDIIPTGFKDLTQAVHTSSERLNTFLVQRSTPASTQPQTEPRRFPLNWTEEDLASFYPSLQYLAIVTIYLVVHARRHSRTLSPTDLSSINVALQPGYFIAILGFLNALNLSTYQSGPSNTSGFTITSENPILESHVDTWIAALIALSQQGRMSPGSDMIESGKNAVDLLMIPPPSPTPPSSPSPPAT